jgi:NAD(P)H dehydrogenase (quinone)
MAKALVIYYSRTGNTKKMGELIADSLKKEGVNASLKDVLNVKVDELLQYDALIIGSATYYGSMSSEIKKLLDDSVKFHGKLEGKVGGAFASSANVAGGNETTILDILNAMLIHGMILQGDPRGDHYGPVSVGIPDERAMQECLRMGGRIAELLRRISK